jgi:hypothetical protein
MAFIIMRLPILVPLAQSQDASLVLALEIIHALPATAVLYLHIISMPQRVHAFNALLIAPPVSPTEQTNVILV